MYSDRTLNARSTKERSFQDSHSAAAGISSGMYRPPSEARPLRTTSSKESWCDSERQRRLFFWGEGYGEGRDTSDVSKER